MKVVHVLASLNAGGIEKWLHDLALENNRSSFFSLTVIINSPVDVKDFFQERIENLGVNVVKVTSPKKSIIKYLWEIYMLLREENFDVIHCHSYYFSGLIMLISRFASIPVRITHSHNDKTSDNLYNKGLRAFYIFLMKKFINLFSTSKLAVSDLAGHALFGNDSYHILPCGLDYRRCDALLGRAGNILGGYDLSNTTVISHVGSFSYQKNHDFMFEIAKELESRKKSKRDFLFVFIGDGPNRIKIQNDFDSLNNVKSVFLGLRTDVKEILFEYCDIFIFPSRYEGLGLAALEAQAQGIYCICSEMVPEEVFISERLKVLPITDSNISHWADNIQAANVDEIRKNKESNSNVIMDKVIITDFSIENNIKELAKIYMKDC